jgi:SAM-dependent methyltransferase
MGGKTIKQRLRYSYLHPRYLAHRELKDLVVKEAPQLVGRLLDVGCGQTPYKELLAASPYIGVDRPVTMHGLSEIDAFSTAVALPFAPESFDSLLCTEVLEHLPQPELALQEMGRVARPGALLLVTAPFGEQLHEEPFDYYRFTHYGLQDLLTRNGWETLTLHHRGGTWLELGYRFSSFLYSALGATRKADGSMHTRMILGPVVIGVCVLVQLLADGLDRVWKVELSTIGYGILARKSLMGREQKL